MTSRHALPMAAILLLCAHAALSVAMPAQGAVTSLDLSAAAAIAMLASLRQARRLEGAVRTEWRLAAIAFLVWAVAFATTFYRETLLHVDTNAAGPQDLVLFLRGVPLLFALTIPKEDTESQAFPWIDGAQMLFAVLLACLVIFPNSLVFGHAARPLAGVGVTWALDLENALLVGVTALRLVANPSGREKRFYLCIGGFLASYAVLSAFLNQNAIEMRHVRAGSPIFLLMDIPFLLYVLATSYWTVKAEPGPRPLSAKRMSLYVGYGSPVFFALAVVMLGAMVLRDHLLTGVAAIAIGVLLYGLRSTIMQVRYVDTQVLLHGVMERLEEVSRLDPLTNIPNRRSFDSSLEVAWNLARRGAQPLSILMIDVDLFKSYNDTKGHQVGDECLVTVASMLRGHLQRESDVVARYGGEEFAVILPFTDLAGAQFVAQSLRQAIYQLGMPHEASPQGVLTVSIGVASQTPFAGDKSDTLLQEADKALYRAKSNGRNRVELAQMSRES